MYLVAVRHPRRGGWLTLRLNGPLGLVRDGGHSTASLSRAHSMRLQPQLQRL